MSRTATGGENSFIPLKCVNFFDVRNVPDL